ncbi:unnamed protein product [Arabidopsis arenosa]|uniref:Uncharacterized protein n=1 Tax=Arabidopsis arenosa TaxID=38785 RepID=A0A8S2B054_ARAAE|nr:unnamed protein product [Arabidopsis arenosa]
MDQTAEPPLNTHQQQPEEVQHHENGTSKMFRKVKARAKKFKNSITKHDQSNEHDHDVVEEDDELEPEVIDAPGVKGKPESLSHPRETNVPAAEEIVPPGYTKPTESVPSQDTSYGHDAPAHSVRTTVTSDKEESREAHHEAIDTPLLSATEDIKRTFAPSGDDDYLDGQRKVNVETPIKLEEVPPVTGGGSDYLSGASNYQSKVTDPTKEGSGEARVPEITESLGNMKVTDESPDQKPPQGFERDLSTRSKEFKEFDQEFDSVLGKDSPVKSAGESEAELEKDFPMRNHTESGNDKNSPTGFGGESGVELEKDFTTRSHDFDMKTEAGTDTNSPSRSYEFDLKTESGNDKNSPMGFGSESGAELGRELPTGSDEFDQKIESGRNEYSPESDGGLGAPLGGNFPVKNESGIDKDSPTGFDGEPDFLAKGRPGYGEASEEDNFPARSDDVKVETELGRDLPTETHDQFSPDISRPKERDEFKESRDDFEETRDEKTEEPKTSTYTEKFASMLGYSGEIPAGDQSKVTGTDDEKLTPINEKDQETESALTTKLPLPGGGSGVEEQQGEGKSVSSKDYPAEKLTPEEEDKAFSEMIAEKLQIGGGEEKKETTTKDVEKIPTEKALAAGEQGEVTGTDDEKLTPVNEKDQETESALTTKLPLSGGGSGAEEQRGEDKNVSGRDYPAEKLTPEEEEKAFSEMIAEKLQIGGGEEKKTTTTKEVEKIPTEKASEEGEQGEAVDEEVNGGGGGMVGRIKGWFGGAATDEVKPKSPHSVEEAPKTSGWFGGGATEEVKPKSPHSVEESPQSLGSTVVPLHKEL